ncbi:MAG: exodeoxyribonuclease VII small subunit [Candidatus Omnitrophica bacterium]|nr:exodeoxyribonuclease VII small subunit [Candidatus Omnitrophota bacterium]
MKEVTFEKAIEKLESIVSELESGDLALDQSMKKYEDGIKLARFCQEKLEKAKARIDMLMKEPDGNFTKKPFNAEKGKEEGEE